MSTATLMPIPQNFKNSVDWILGAYTDADVTFPNGFQKDAIQNCVGARKSLNNWNNWVCDISLVENANGRFVIVEDSGTVGLTGRNIPGTEVNAMMAREETLPPEERLARFSSMFNSGGNATGQGLFGAGKSVYSVASEEYTYYFDSLREDGKYVANMNERGQVYPLAFEGDAAKAFIFEKTGLSEKSTTGTRIIIKSPKAELTDSITSGEIIPFIQESWWLIISRLGKGSRISVNGVPVTVPAGIKEGTHVYELPATEQYASNYRVKHFGLYVFQQGGNIWDAISYYRRGMKIGEIELKDIPEKLKGKFWGYIEVDEAWELELADIEDKVHFGVSKGKRKTTTYQNLKNYCNNKVRALLTEWGFIKDKESADKKLKDQLQQIADNIQDLFDKLGFEDLGKGPQKADFDVRWQNIQYPVAGTERVATGDKIGFTIRIKSSYTTDKKFEYRLLVENPQNGAVVHQIATEKITVRSNTVFTEDFSLKISKENSIKFAENRIVLVVKVVGSGKEKRKELPYYYDIDKPVTKRESVSLVLHECLFPQQGSRRVNFEESVKKVCYRIENNRNHKLSYKLNVSIHNASDPTCPKIVDVVSFKGEVQPFEEVLTDYIEEILFAESVYSQHLQEGVLELRARLIANEDDLEFEKGDKITFYHYKVFLNCDEKHGKSESFEIVGVEEPGNYRRSWNVPGTGRKIYINLGHTAYLNLQDHPDIQHEYLREQMLKQYVWLYLSEGRYDMFGAEFADLEPQEAAPRVLEKMETVYYESLR